VSQIDPERRPARRGRLDRLLARWADVHRLDASRAEAIRAAIVSVPTTRDFDWWWRLLDPMGGTAFRAVRRRIADADPADVPASRALSPSIGTAIWRADSADDYQPYLRLT
jgi:hypothetical protein